MTKISVVVPVYNTEEYLVKCLDSLALQTIDSIEVVVVDDGSTDSSPEIIEHYAQKYPDRIKAYRKENGGQATARNLGITKCTGEYIGFVDSDDFVEREMFQQMYEMAIAREADLVECNYRYVEERDGAYLPLKEYGHVREYKSQRDMFINPLVSPWNKLIKAEILHGMETVFPEGLIYEDTAFFIKIIPKVKKTAFLDKAYVWHILRGTSTMNANRSKKVGNIFPVLEDIITYYKKMDWYQQYFKEVEYFCIKILLCSSLERVSQVKDRGLKKEFVKKTQDMIVEYFRDYRKNTYFHKGTKNRYMKSVNRITIHLYCMVFGIMNVEHGGINRK